MRLEELKLTAYKAVENWRAFNRNGRLLTSFTFCSRLVSFAKQTSTSVLKAEGGF